MLVPAISAALRRVIEPCPYLSRAVLIREQLLAKDFACHVFKLFEGDPSDLLAGEGFAESGYFDDFDAAVVRLVYHMVAWLQSCFLSNFSRRKQFSFLPYATRGLCRHLFHRNNLYSLENISVTRRIVIHQKSAPRHDLHAPGLRH